MPPINQNQSNPETRKSPHSPGKRTAIAGILSVSLLMASGMAIYQGSLFTNTAADQTATAANAKRPFPHVELDAQSAVVLDMTTGERLFQKNPNAQLPLASLTKVMLMLVVEDELPKQSTISIRDTAFVRGEGGTPSVGETWTREQLIDYTLITSSNVGAEALAEATNPFVLTRFPQATADHPTVWRMNTKASELGMAQTTFQNASGLDISTTLAGAYGSAADMATLFSYAARSYSALFESTTENGVLLSSTNGAMIEAENTNDALGSIPGLVMGKTGTTDLAGGNLALVFEVGPAHPVALIILGSGRESRFEDAQRLIQATYSYLEQ